MRIALFQCDWPFQVHTANLAAALSDLGYEVDLFLYRTPSFFDVASLTADPNIHLCSLSRLSSAMPSQVPTELSDTARSGFLDPLRHVFHEVQYQTGRLKRWAVQYRRYKWGKKGGLIPNDVLNASWQEARAHDYQAMIGIEKKGLIWAGMLAQRMEVPLVYYSLELYTQDHEAVQSMDAKRVKYWEQYYHRRAAGTIVQDEMRAEVLFRDNAARPPCLLRLPVSLRGGARKDKSLDLRRRFQLKDEKILLYVGKLDQDRMIPELVAAVQSLPHDWRLVLHGWGDRELIESIRQWDHQNKVLVSREALDWEGLSELVASADIGLVFYRQDRLNEMLTAKASEKLALYLQCGLPVVSFQSPGLELLEQYGCGVRIESFQSLPNALDKLLPQMAQYRTNAFRCFDEVYCFDKYISSVYQFLSELTLTQSKSSR